MNKVLIAFLMLFISPVFAAPGDNKIVFSAETVETAIQKMVAAENQAGAAATYESQMDGINGEISISGLYAVCNAAGFDIRQSYGFDDCRRFVKFMLDKTSIGGGDQCFGEYNGVQTDGKCVGRDGAAIVYAKSCNGGNGTCVRDFSKLQTQTPIGKEFIYKWGESRGLKITCANYAAETMRGLTSPLGQDYLRCTAGGRAYEFEFDDLNQNPGDTATESENAAMCKLFGGTPGPNDKVWYQCDISRDACNKIISFATTIGHNGMYHGYCRLGKNAQRNNAMFLKTAFGIDNKVFYRSKIQSRADLVQRQLEEYLRTNPATRGQSSIRCQPQIKQITDAVGQYANDYYMTCYVGGQQIDFVFDDLTEALDSYATGGAQAMSCIVSGGTYDGKKCRGLEQKQCEALARANIADCPECKAAKWDFDPRNPTVKTCLLPSSARATNIQKGVRIAGIVGLSVAGTVVTVATAGTGVGAVAIVLVEVTGAGLEIGSEIALSRVAQDFMSRSEQCRTASCAETMLRDDLQRISNLASSFTDVEIAAIDSELARLIELLPDDSPVYKRTLADNSLGFFDADSWEPEQVIRALGISMQMTGLAAALGTKAVRLTKTSTAFKRGVQNADGVAKVSINGKFYDAWQNYAPKNEGFNDFMKTLHSAAAQTGKTIDAQLDEWIKAWTPISEMQLDRVAIQRYENEISDILERIYGINNRGYLGQQLNAISDSDFEQYISNLRKSGVPQSDIDALSSSRNRLLAERARNDGNYSTFNPQISKMRNDYTNNLNLIDNEYDKFLNRVRNDYVGGRITQQQMESNIQSIENLRVAEKNKLKSKATLRLFADGNTKIPYENMARIVAEREQMYLDIIGSNDDLRNIAMDMILNPEKVSDYSKAYFTQRVLNESGDINCLGDNCLFVQRYSNDLNPLERNSAGLYYRADPRNMGGSSIHIVEDANPTFNQRIGTLVHEEGHRIDAATPNIGALGAQRENFGNMIYQNANSASYEVYLKAPTEYSSFNIGNLANEFDRKLLKKYGTPEEMQKFLEMKK